MPGKKTYLLLIASLLVSMVIMASASGWKAPLSQMDMPTATSALGTTQSTTEPGMQDTPVPQVNPPASNLASPTPTSIFTGYTPDPTGMGSTAGMYGMGGMGMNGTPMATGSAMNGMGSMSMSCPMMSGSGMSGMSSMSGMGSGDDLLMSGMDMDEVSSSAVYGIDEESVNPWIILGWVLLGVVVVAIIAAIVLGIILLLRQTRQAPPA